MYRKEIAVNVNWYITSTAKLQKWQIDIRVKITNRSDDQQTDKNRKSRNTVIQIHKK